MKKWLFLPLLLMTTVIAAFNVAMLIVTSALKPPEEDIRLLFAFMFSTGTITVSVVYIVHRFKLVQRFNSLRWVLLTLILLMVVLIFLNVWITAQLMFISPHDLVLTTALLIFSGIITVVSVLVISSALTNRIDALAAAARRLAQGDLLVRLPADGNDELAHLAKTFNAMAGSLQELDAQKQAVEQTRRDLIAWVSHDLRTPLAAMRAMNEAILDGVVSDAQTVERYTLTIQKEIQHLSHLIDDLFELVHLDSGQLHLVREMTSLSDLISDTIGSVGVRAARQEIMLDCDVDQGIDPVYIAADKIQRVLSNLLDNALHHTPQGGKITLTAKLEKEQVRVSIHNTGSYITQSDLALVFQSFYRSERSRARASDGYRGTGLGLAIAKGFIEAHGGELQANSSPQQGTTFLFSLPKVKPTDTALERAR